MQRALILANNGVVDDKCIILDEASLEDALQGSVTVADGVEPTVDVRQIVEQSNNLSSNSPSNSNTSKSLSADDSAVRNQKIPSDLGGELKQQEYQIILDALIECRGSRQEVAEKLGIAPRTLRYKIAKMRELGMIIPG